MEAYAINEKNNSLESLCETVKNMVLSGRYELCYDLICNAMSEYPDSAIPHNLMGIWCEKEGFHVEAMKHFRAAYALEPTYAPASQNLDTYGTFNSTGRCAFVESDCVESVKVVDQRKRGLIVRRFL